MVIIEPAVPGARLLRLGSKTYSSKLQRMLSKDLTRFEFAKGDATTTAMVAKTSLKKLIRAASIFIGLIPSRSVRQMLANFSGVEFWRTVAKVTNRKRKSLPCVHVLPAWNTALSRDSHAKTAKKCTKKKRDARVNLLFCLSNLLLFCRSRCRLHPRCLSSVKSNKGNEGSTSRVHQRER